MMKVMRLIKRILASKKGAGAVTILMMILIPAVFIVPAVAIDLKVYSAIKGQLYNSLDAVSLSALNESTIDRYRSDKILKLKSPEFYVDKVEEGIRSNFSPEGDVIQRSVDPDNPNKYILKFKPGFEFTPDEAVVEVNFPSDSKQDDTGDLGKGIGVELKLNTKVRLPVSGRLLEVFNVRNMDISKMKMQVVNRINGIRVKEDNDFSE